MMKTKEYINGILKICCDVMDNETLYITAENEIAYDTGEGVGDLTGIKYCWNCGKKVEASYL